MDINATTALRAECSNNSICLPRVAISGQNVDKLTLNTGLSKSKVRGESGRTSTPTASMSTVFYHVKDQFVLLGSNGVGKTTILRRLQNPNRTESLGTIGGTIGPDLYRLECGLIEAIDIGGGEDCTNISHAYCDLFHSFMVVFDITDAETFLAAKYWLDRIQTNSPVSEQNKLVLIGNKKDLISKRKVSHNLARNLAMAHNADYFEISARFDITLDRLIQKFR